MKWFIFSDFINVNDDGGGGGSTFKYIARSLADSLFLIIKLISRDGITVVYFSEGIKFWGNIP